MASKKGHASEEAKYIRPPPPPPPTLDSILAKVRKPVTRAALEAARGKPKGDPLWRAAEKAGWNDVVVDTRDCLWLREQADAVS